MGEESYGDATPETSSSEMARNIIMGAVKQESAPHLTLPEEGAPSVPDSQPESTQAPQEPEAPQAPPAAPEPAAPTAVDDTGYARLLAEGIDLGIRKSELPAELHAAYDRIVDNAANAKAEVLRQQAVTQEALMQVQDFQRQLQENPKQVLLTMATQDPQAFEGVVSEYQRMQEDPQYAEVVRRDLSAQAMMLQAQRQMVQHQQTVAAQKAARVRSMIDADVAQFGTNAQFAEKILAAEITNNGGDITDQQVMQVLSQLRPVTPVGVVTPEANAAAAAAPNQSFQGAQAPAAATDSAEASAPTGPVRSPIRNLIKSAADRVGRSG